MMARDPEERPARRRRRGRGDRRLGDLAALPGGAAPAVDPRQPGVPTRPRHAGSLTLSEQRLVTVVLAGDAEPPGRGGPTSSRAPTLGELARRGRAPRRRAPRARGRLAGGDAVGRGERRRPGRAGGALRPGAAGPLPCAAGVRGHRPRPGLRARRRGRDDRARRARPGGDPRRRPCASTRSRPACSPPASASTSKAASDKPVARLLRGERAAPEGGPLLLGQATPWVGRARELSMLEGVFSGCVSEPVASAVLVVGEPGSGKSRLRREFLDALAPARRPVEILTGGGEALGARLAVPHGRRRPPARRRHRRGRAARRAPQQAPRPHRPPPALGAQAARARPFLGELARHALPRRRRRGAAAPLATAPGSWATPCAPRGKTGSPPSAPRSPCSWCSRISTGATPPPCASSTPPCGTSATCR